jgi:alkylation response protein AidB-like acyl-CoA dehydrogenase
MARAFLTEHSGSEQVRTAMESELGWDRQVWKQIGAELGWTSVTIPEEYGGLGLGYVELVALLEVTGEALLCAPFFSSVCLAANAILAAGSDAQRGALLPGIAEGQTVATLAVSEISGRPEADDIQALARPDGDGYRLSGSKRFVVDGHCADLLIVAARSEGSRGENGISLFAVAGDAPGLSRSALPTMDRTRRLAALELRDVRVPASARLGEEGAEWPALQRALDLAAIGLAAEQVGGAQRCLDDAVAYAKERVQFGRPVGSFQAIKHKCADRMVDIEAARSGLYYAACVAAEGAESLPEAASLAKATASDAFFRCAADSIQIHGGVGFTFEYDAHLFFKRARAGEQLLGSPEFHRERVARRIGL